MHLYLVDTSMERSSRVLYREGPKIDFLFKNMLTWVFLLSCFVIIVLCTLIGTIMLSINIYLGLGIHLCSLHAYLCFVKFVPLNLDRGCIVVPSRVDI